MKSLHIRDFCQHNLKGKLTKLLSCKCCMIQNFKWKEKVKQANKEIKNET